MTLRQIAEKYGLRIKAFLAQVATAIRSHQVEVDDPAEMFEPEETWQWGILVYPWAKHSAQQLPDEALDIWLKLVSYKDEDRLMVDIVCDLITVGGGGVEEFDTGQGLMPADDRMFLEETIRYFEQPATIRKVVKSALKYIAEARQKPPSGPHEWSPRWQRRPSMGAAAKAKAAPIRINLVEHPEWKKRWEPGNAYISQASDLASEYVAGIDRDTLRGLVETLAKDIFHKDSQSGPQDWTPRNVLGPEDLDLITEKLQEDSSMLEATYSPLIDAATWMYESALMPDDGDAHAALESALEKFEKEKRYSLDWDLWEPLLATGVDAQDILHKLFGRSVVYERHQGQYDRNLVFHLELSGAPNELLKLVPRKDQAGVMRAVKDEWKDLVKSFIPYFFRALDKQMQDIDLSNRINWKSAWRTVLADRDNGPYQTEMLKFIREQRRKGSSA